jgi:tRNA (guanine-N7-)-methyltransferase
MSRRNAKRLPLPELQPYVLRPPTPPTRFDWLEVFKNNHPVELEDGFGKGAFLVAVSQAHPGTNYLGIEIDYGHVLCVAGRLAKRKLNNVLVVRGDAGTILRDQIPAGSLHAIHVYFPDPWWKRRHRKRRVFTAEFAQACERALQPGGRLHLASDVEEYFGVMTKIVAKHTRLMAIEIRQPESLIPAAEVVTNFQRKALEEGRPVWRAEYLAACSTDCQSVPQ